MGGAANRGFEYLFVNFVLGVLKYRGVNSGKIGEFCYSTATSLLSEKLKDNYEFTLFEPDENFKVPPGLDYAVLGITPGRCKFPEYSALITIDSPAQEPFEVEEFVKAAQQSRVPFLFISPGIDLNNTQYKEFAADITGSMIAYYLE